MIFPSSHDLEADAMRLAARVMGKIAHGRRIPTEIVLSVMQMTMLFAGRLRSQQTLLRVLRTWALMGRDDLVRRWADSGSELYDADAIEQCHATIGEIRRLEALLAGSARAPDEAQVLLHAQCGGTWRVVARDGSIEDRVGEARWREIVASGGICRWWATDAHGAIVRPPTTVPA